MIVVFKNGTYHDHAAAEVSAIKAEPDLLVTLDIVAVVFKDGTYRVCSKYDAEYYDQQNPDWLVTIPLHASSLPDEVEGFLNKNKEGACCWCGEVHVPKRICPRVKAMDFDPVLGKITRYEFFPDEKAGAVPE